MIGSDVRHGLGVIRMLLLRRRNGVNFINKSWKPATHYFVDIHKMNVKWVKVTEGTPLCCPFTFLTSESSRHVSSFESVLVTVPLDS